MNTDKNKATAQGNAPEIQQSKAFDPNEAPYTRKDIGRYVKDATPQTIYNFAQDHGLIWDALEEEEMPEYTARLKKFEDEAEDFATEYMEENFGVEGAFWGRNEHGDWGLWEETSGVLKLAQAFVRQLRDNLSLGEFIEVRKSNARAPYANSNSCASHDFIDANEVMASAFHEVFRRDPDLDSGSDTVLWSKAWDIAKKQYLTDTPDETPTMPVTFPPEIKATKTYRITETCVYEVPATSEDEAVRILLDCSPSERDGVYFVELDDRQIELA